MIWLSNFNRHYPHWDKPDDMHLFTKEALKAVKILIEATAEAGLEMVLLGGIPMHIHNVTKKWSRLDQVFILDHSTNLVNTCDMVTSLRGINTDHIPILTKIDLATPIAEVNTTHNFREHCKVDTS